MREKIEAARDTLRRAVVETSALGPEVLQQSSDRGWRSVYVTHLDEDALPRAHISRFDHITLIARRNGGKAPGTTRIVEHRT